MSQRLKARVRRLSTEGSTFIPRAKHIIINWGNSTEYDDRAATVWNDPVSLEVAHNKLLTLGRLLEWMQEEGHSEINLPDWTEYPEVVKTWVEEGHTVVARETLTGHSGAGIVIISGPQAWENYHKRAPLYTKYIKKKSEYRVHVAFGEVIDIQQKKKRHDFDGEPNYLVRNHSNGWVYCREDIVASADLKEQALRAVVALGLDFGAVDIIYNERQNKCYVLEVNTAPGLEGTTVEKYTDAFIKELATHANQR